MHELGITQNIVAIVVEHSQGVKVRRIVVEIGKLSAILPEAIAFCFGICSQGTVLEQAKLEIREIPGLARCHECGTEFVLEKPFGICSCGSVNFDLIAGEELLVKEIEVQEICV
jgi:hydrogenase nickel incorporation protein HypA/HybF